MENNGWICLYRKLLDWEWYQDNNVKAVFIHCLLKANYEDKKWRGITVHRGEFITSYDKLQGELGMPRSTIRRILKRLEQSGEISLNSEQNFTVVKCLNYCVYQDVAQESETQMEHKRNISGTKVKPTNNNNKYNKYNKHRMEGKPSFDIEKIAREALLNDDYDI